MNTTIDTVSEARLEALDSSIQLLVFSKAAAAMADPVRLAILSLLDAHGEMTVGALTQALPVSQPRVSVHLQCLTRCGFTVVRRQGRRAFYRLAGPAVSELLDRLRAHAAASLEGLLTCLDCAPADVADDGCSQTC